METNSFSRYRDIKSVIHSIDPIVKLLAFLTLVFATFLAQSVYSLLTVLAFIFVVSLFARVRFVSYFRILILIIPFYIMMFLMYWFALRSATEASLSVAYMSLRFYLFILLSIIYTSTTKEMDIASSIEWLITPLRLIKVPTYEISMMIMLAIRFIPLMFEDMISIMIAQTSRGVNVYNGNLRTKIKGIFNSLLPMFVLAFKRSEDVSNAMIIRGYEIGVKRSKYKKNKYGILEFISTIIMILLVIAIIYLGVM